MALPLTTIWPAQRPRPIRNERQREGRGFRAKWVPRPASDAHKPMPHASRPSAGPGIRRVAGSFGVTEAFARSYLMTHVVSPLDGP